MASNIDAKLFGKIVVHLQLGLQSYLQVMALGTIAYASLTEIEPTLVLQTFIWTFLASVLGGCLQAYLQREPGVIYGLSAGNTFLFASTLALSLHEAKHIGADWQFAFLLTSLFFIATTLVLLTLYYGRILAWSRFIPIQVCVGVALLGTGLSIGKNQIEVVQHATPWFGFAVLVCVAIVMWVQSKRPLWSHWLFLLFLCSAGHFLSTLVDLNFPVYQLVSHDQVKFGMWFFELDQSNFESIIKPAEWANLHWKVLAGHLLFLVTMRILDFCLPLQTWELVSGRSVDVGRAFQSAHSALLVLPLLGLVPTSIQVRSSMYSVQKYAEGLPWQSNIWIGFIVVLMLAITFVFNVQAIPQLLITSILLTLGIGFQSGINQTIKLANAAPKQAWFLGLVFVLVGSVWAIFCGLVLAVAFFIRDSERSAMKQIRNLSQVRSRLWRSVEDYAQLAREAKRVAVFEIQGALNFAVTHKLREDVRAYMVSLTTTSSRCYAILDLSQVTLVDESGRQFVSSLKKMLSDINTELLIGCAPSKLHRTTLLVSSDHVFPTLDLALEYAEDALLSKIQIDSVPPPRPAVLSKDASHGVPAVSIFEKLNSEQAHSLYLTGTLVQLQSGDTLFNAGAQDPSFYLVLKGRINIGIDPSAPRFSSLGVGRILGEMAFLDGQARSACAYVPSAEASVQLWRIEREAFDEWATLYPIAAQQMLLVLVQELADRLRVQHLKV